MKKKIFALLLIIGINQAYSQKLDFEIKYNVETKSEKYGEGKNLDSNAILAPFTNDLVIKLQNDGSFTTSLNKQIITLYDLNKEIILKYNPDTLYSAIPLHSIIDYRIAEYKNRTFLSNMLQEGGIETAFGNLTNLESIFGIEDEKYNIRDSIILKTNDNNKVYMFNNKDLVEVKYSKIKLPKEYIESFFKYLTYSTEIHPYIKEEIIKTKLVPIQIQYNYVNVGIKTTKTYNFIGSEKTQHLNNDIYSKKRFLFQRNLTQMGGIIDSMMFYTMFNKPTPLDSSIYFSEAKKLLNQGENLSGLLRLLEYSLSTGNQPTNQLRSILPKQKTDSVLASFLYCLNPPKSKEEAELKISTLNTLISLNIDYGYLMNIFAANYIEPIDQYEAISYFQKALSKNQYITGAWFDLGRIYSNRYNYDDAWKCFEIMMNIKMDHPMAQEILIKKSSLKNNYPDYFKSN